MTLQRKKVKYLRLAIKPPEGEVRISVPMHVQHSDVLHFISEHLPWIIQTQKKFKNTPKKPVLQYLSGEKHYFLGEEKVLVLHENSYIKTLRQEGDNLRLYCRGFQNKTSASAIEHRKKILDDFYRQKMRVFIPQFIEKYLTPMGVEVNDWGIKKMKTRWGTCNITDQRIWLNLELAKYPLICLEYVVVHEMVHLLERNHTKRFWMLVAKFMPEWGKAKDLLNQQTFS